MNGQNPVSLKTKIKTDVQKKRDQKKIKPDFKKIYLNSYKLQQLQHKTKL